MTPYTTSSIISKDGTKVSYRQLGKGPGLILVHGGLQSAQNFMQLAESLADDFTLYIPDRRGRGLSGPYGDNYGVKKECEDIEALLEKTGAHFIYGLSSGAIISLNATLTLPKITKTAIYEPPFPIDPTTPGDKFAERYNRELDQGKLGAAFLTVLTGLQMASFLRLIPRFIIVPLLDMRLKKQVSHDGNIPLKEIVPTFKYDHILVKETKGELDKFKQIKTEVLLLSGSKSPRYLKNVITALAAILPNSKHIEFNDLDHMGSDNIGQPAVVAAELRRFFVDSKK